MESPDKVVIPIKELQDMNEVLEKWVNSPKILKL